MENCDYNRKYCGQFFCIREISYKRIYSRDSISCIRQYSAADTGAAV